MSSPRIGHRNPQAPENPTRAENEQPPRPRNSILSTLHRLVTSCVGGSHPRSPRNNVDPPPRREAWRDYLAPLVVPQNNGATTANNTAQTTTLSPRHTPNALPPPTTRSLTPTASTPSTAPLTNTTYFSPSQDPSQKRPQLTYAEFRKKIDELKANEKANFGRSLAKLAGLFDPRDAEVIAFLSCQCPGDNKHTEYFQNFLERNIHYILIRTPPLAKRGIDKEVLNNQVCNIEQAPYREIIDSEKTILAYLRPTETNTQPVYHICETISFLTYNLRFRHSEKLLINPIDRTSIETKDIFWPMDNTKYILPEADANKIEEIEEIENKDNPQKTNKTLLETIISVPVREFDKAQKENLNKIKQKLLGFIDPHDASIIAALASYQRDDGSQKEIFEHFLQHNLHRIHERATRSFTMKTPKFVFEGKSYDITDSYKEIVDYKEPQLIYHKESTEDEHSLEIYDAKEFLRINTIDNPSKEGLIDPEDFSPIDNKRIYWLELPESKTQKP